MPPSIRECEVGVDGLLLVSMPARVSHLLALRELLDAFAVGCAASASARATIAAALTEAFCSVVRDSSPSERAEVVELLADADEGFLDVILRHSGRGIRMLQPVPCEPASHGAGLIAQLADELSIDERPDGRTELWMRFGIQ